MINQRICRDTYRCLSQYLRVYVDSGILFLSVTAYLWSIYVYTETGMDVFLCLSLSMINVRNMDTLLCLSIPTYVCSLCTYHHVGIYEVWMSSSVCLYVWYMSVSMYDTCLSLPVYVCSLCVCKEEGMNGCLFVSLPVAHFLSSPSVLVVAICLSWYVLFCLILFPNHQLPT